MRTVTLPTGEQVSALGQGTWNIGDNRSTRDQEIKALQLGIDLGLTLIDTAEMYGSGRSEELVGDAIAGKRDKAFLVSKVLPSNASRKGTLAACEASLRRLKTDRLDLYLLHWRGSFELEETIGAFNELIRAGKIRRWGVSNLDVNDMAELLSIPGGDQVATNQVLYNLVRRGIEWNLLPLLRKRRIPIMAYSPIEQAKLSTDKKLIDFARRSQMTPTQVALAWLLRHDDVIVIPKTSKPERVKENAGALDYALNEIQLAELDGIFPPPKKATPLDMI